MSIVSLNSEVVVDQYQEALEKFASLLNHSHDIKGDYAGYAYEKVPSEFKAPILNALQNWVDFYELNAQSGKVSDKQLLWRFLSVFKLSPDSNFFSLIDDDTCVEALNRSGLQTFRSLSFMDVCSYTLDEVVSVPWQYLYTRDENITVKYMELQKAITDGSLLHTDLQGIIPSHKVCEVSGFDRLATTIQPMYLSPLYDQSKNVVGAVHAFKIIDCKSMKAPVNIFSKNSTMQL